MARILDLVQEARDGCEDSFLPKGLRKHCYLFLSEEWPGVAQGKGHSFCLCTDCGIRRVADTGDTFWRFQEMLRGIGDAFNQCEVLALQVWSEI